jgi:hypothetical protein
MKKIMDVVLEQIAETRGRIFIFTDDQIKASGRARKLYKRHVIYHPPAENHLTIETTRRSAVALSDEISDHLEKIS